jgi:hypothetical protein
MPKKRSFDLTDEVEELWKRYESEYDAKFSKMANKAIKEYLTKKLGK